MLVTINPIEPGDKATPNLWNSRYAAITSVVNGGIDSDNIKNGAVTREKIASASITSDKLLITRSYDEAGWLVTDYGDYKRYSRTGTFSQSIAGNAFQYISTGVAYPTGCTYQNIVGSYLSVTDQAISIGFNSNSANITFNVQNKYGLAAPCTAQWGLTFEK